MVERDPLVSRESEPLPSARPMLGACASRRKDMIGPADIEAWSEDEATRPDAGATPIVRDRPRVLPFPAPRPDRPLFLVRECAEMFGWGRRRSGRGV
jgi:hypothetical protein